MESRELSASVSRILNLSHSFIIIYFSLLILLLNLTILCISLFLGVMSMQEAAICVLRHYESHFPTFNPAFDQVITFQFKSLILLFEALVISCSRGGKIQFKYFPVCLHILVLLGEAVGQKASGWWWGGQCRLQDVRHRRNGRRRRRAQ